MKQKRKMSLFWLVGIILILGTLAGCGAQDGATEVNVDKSGTHEVKPTGAGQTASKEATGSGNEPAGADPESVAPFPVTIKDSTGTEVTIAAEPKRIISIIPSATETAFALGLGERVVGVSDWDNYPEDVKNKEKIGGLNVNTEKIVSLKPDLILAHSPTARASRHYGTWV